MNNENKLGIKISNNPNWGDFDKIIRAFVSELKCKIIQKEDVLNRRYWDLEINGILMTLSLDKYYGITLMSEIENSIDLLPVIEQVLNKIEFKP